MTNSSASPASPTAASRWEFLQVLHRMCGKKSVLVLMDSTGTAKEFTSAQVGMDLELVQAGNVFLAGLGAEGWDLVSVQTFRASSYDENTFWLKRPLSA